jgi:hypothetical protein
MLRSLLGEASGIFVKGQDMLFRPLLAAALTAASFSVIAPASAEPASPGLALKLGEAGITKVDYYYPRRYRYRDGPYYGDTIFDIPGRIVGSAFGLVTGALSGAVDGAFDGGRFYGDPYDWDYYGREPGYRYLGYYGRYYGGRYGYGTNDGSYRQSSYYGNRYRDGRGSSYYYGHRPYYGNSYHGDDWRYAHGDDFGRRRGRRSYGDEFRGDGWGEAYAAYARSHYSPASYYGGEYRVADRQYPGLSGASYEAGGVAACEREFRSFDPETGTYIDYDGEQVACPYLRP